MTSPAFLLGMLDYDEPERVVHQHLEDWLLDVWGKG